MCLACVSLFATVIETGPPGHSRTERLYSVGRLVAAVFFTFASGQMLRVILLHHHAGGSDVILSFSSGAVTAQNAIPSELADSSHRLTDGWTRPPPHPQSFAASASERKSETAKESGGGTGGPANGSEAHLEESVCRPSWQCCGRQQRRSWII